MTTRWSSPASARLVLGFLTLASSILLSGPSNAQESVAKTPQATTGSTSAIDDADLGDTIFLSPFEVDASTDAGWRSTNTTSGTSLNTPIKELPMSIEVINEDFIDDTGATNFKEALARMVK